MGSCRASGPSARGTCPPRGGGGRECYKYPAPSRGPPNALVPGSRVGVATLAFPPRGDHLHSRPQPLLTQPKHGPEGPSGPKHLGSRVSGKGPELRMPGEDSPDRGGHPRRRSCSTVPLLGGLGSSLPLTGPGSRLDNTWLKSPKPSQGSDRLGWALRSQFLTSEARVAWGW